MIYFCISEFLTTRNSRLICYVEFVCLAIESVVPATLMNREAVLFPFPLLTRYSSHWIL